MNFSKSKTQSQQTEKDERTKPSEQLNLRKRTSWPTIVTLTFKSNSSLKLWKPFRQKIGTFTFRCRMPSVILEAQTSSCRSSTKKRKTLFKKSLLSKDTSTTSLVSLKPNHSSSNLCLRRETKLFSSYKLSKQSLLIKSKTEQIYKELSDRKRTKGQLYCSRSMSFKQKFKLLQVKRIWRP